MPKKNRFDWGVNKSDDTVHHISWPWDDNDDEPMTFKDGHPDERDAAEDYESSRLSHSEDD